MLNELNYNVSHAIQFCVDEIRIITSDHGNAKKGEILAFKGDECYMHKISGDYHSDPKCWPVSIPNHGIPLFRDYWKVMGNRKKENAPYFTDHYNAPHDVLVQSK